MTYNDNKKGIDFSDQMSSYYTTLKRGIKWFRKVMLELLFGTALVNSWVIYNIKERFRRSNHSLAYTKTPITESNPGKFIISINTRKVNRGKWKCEGNITN